MPNVKALSASPEDILYAARYAAQRASDESEQKQVSWYPCGFASIRIVPARGKFVSYLKANGIGRKHYYGGWSVSSYDLCNQSDKWCQSMNVKEDAVGAAVTVLRSYGVNADSESRMD